MNKHDKNQKIEMFGAGGVLLAVAVIFLGKKTNSNTITFVGLGIFILSLAAVVIVGNVLTAVDKAKTSANRSSETAKAMSHYQPILADERTKQDPDVQRLLQYPSVQKAFFDPDYLPTPAAQNDPYVRELIGVLDRMLESGDYARFMDVDSTSAYVTELNKQKHERREREKKRPRRIVGNVMAAVGMLMFCVPFFGVFFYMYNENLVYLIGAAPLGMLLVVIGRMIKK